MLGIQARGFALHKATTEPKKLIVVVGTWIWMVPLLIAGLFFFFLGAGALFYGVRDGRAFESLFGLPCGLLGVLFVGIAVIILYRTTTGYVKHRSGGRHGELESMPDGEEDAGDVETCLACGKELAPEATRCPACGWTFGAGTEGDSCSQRQSNAAPSQQ
ncbi:MAG TPA: hypothetical protein VFV87_09910 [Pirellulaceae bacterium]|nr:hypothetical protein [Pirellulaceae bacterium]